MKIVQRVQKLWSGHISVTDSQTDGLTDEGHSNTPIRFATGIKKDVLIPEAKELGRSNVKKCDELVPVFKELCRQMKKIYNWYHRSISMPNEKR